MVVAARQSAGEAILRAIGGHRPDVLAIGCGDLAGSLADQESRLALVRRALQEVDRVGAQASGRIARRHARAHVGSLSRAVSRSPSTPPGPRTCRRGAGSCARQTGSPPRSSSRPGSGEPALSGREGEIARPRGRGGPRALDCERGPSAIWRASAAAGAPLGSRDRPVAVPSKHCSPGRWGSRPGRGCSEPRPTCEIRTWLRWLIVKLPSGWAETSPGRSPMTIAAAATEPGKRPWKPRAAPHLRSFQLPARRGGRREGLKRGLWETNRGEMCLCPLRMRPARGRSCPAW